MRFGSSFFRTNRNFFNKVNNKYFGNVLNTSLNSTKLKCLLSTNIFISKVMFFSLCTSTLKSFKFQNALPIAGENGIDLSDIEKGINNNCIDFLSGLQEIVSLMKCKIISIKMFI